MRHDKILSNREHSRLWIAKSLYSFFAQLDSRNFQITTLNGILTRRRSQSPVKKPHAAAEELKTIPLTVLKSK